MGYSGAESGPNRLPKNEGPSRDSNFKTEIQNIANSPSLAPTKCKMQNSRPHPRIGLDSDRHRTVLAQMGANRFARPALLAWVSLLLGRLAWKHRGLTCCTFPRKDEVVKRIVTQNIPSYCIFFTFAGEIIQKYQTKVIHNKTPAKVIHN